ncbi:MAG: RNA methyltransferase [candidate division Zixibacteria bacterium]
MKLTREELKKIKALNSKKGRKEQRKFAVGGVRLLEEALKHKFLPNMLLYASAGLSARGQKLVTTFKKLKVTVNELSSREIEAVSDTKSSQGILAVFETPEQDLTKLYKPYYRRLLLCDEITDPGNLGTLARSALAFEFDMMLVSRKSIELYNPKVVRSSAGALFKLPLAMVSYEELEDFKDRKKARLIASKASSNNSMTELTLNSNNPIILAIGSEAAGLSEKVLKLSDAVISIAHSPQAESLNVAVAGSLIMKQIYDRDKNQK